MKKRRKKRIKYKNILKLLLFVILFFVIVNIISYFRFNNYIDKNIKNNSLVINTNKKIIKLSKKNLDYLKKSNVKITIKNKNYKYVLKNNFLSNKTLIKLDMDKKQIKNKGFNNSKALIIDTKNKVRNENVSINLPMFLNKRKKVDIYGISGKKYYKLYTKRINNKKVDFKIKNKYKKYIIIYVALKDIKVDNVSMVKNDTKQLNIKLVPSKTTVENYRLKYDKKFINIKNSKLKALKSGITNINLKVNNLNKDITVTIKERKYKITKKNGIYYIDDIMIVNKSYPISKNYDPKGLLKVTKTAYQKMKDDAYRDGITLWIVSGYRSYSDQKTIYNNYVKTSSKKDADTYSARPGYSEHQTGYVMDLNDATSNFENTKAAKWLEKNCYKYGFIIRFPKGKAKYTGYKYEPWHVRYVGKEKAKKITKSGLSLEEYYNISSKYKD